MIEEKLDVLIKNGASVEQFGEVLKKNFADLRRSPRIKDFAEVLFNPQLCAEYTEEQMLLLGREIQELNLPLQYAELVFEGQSVYSTYFRAVMWYIVRTAFNKPTTKMKFVDHADSRSRWFKDKSKKDWVYRIMARKQWSSEGLPNEVETAIMEDDVSGFQVYRALHGLTIDPRMLHYLFINRRSAILNELYTELDWEYEDITLNGLLAMACIWADESLVIELLESIEQRYPHTVVNFRDPCGNTLLWYVLHRKLFMRQELVQKLKACGIDETQMNQYGLNYQICAKATEDLLGWENVSCRKYGERNVR